MSQTETRPIPGDATLVWLASERAAPLFRTLDRARAFDPLLILLAVLPAVLATFGETVTGEDAAWGLRAMAVNGAELPAEAAAGVEAVVPSEAVRAPALWLTAGLMRVVDPTWPISGSLPSLIGGFVLLSLLAPLASTLGGPRLAVWAVAVAAFHPTLVALLRHPAPVTVGLALAVAALWGYLRAEGRSGRAAAAWAAEAFGVGAGLVLMGPVAAAVPILIVADQLLGLALADRRKRSAAGAGGVVVRRLTAALAGVVVAVLIEGTGVAVAAPLTRAAGGPPPPPWAGATGAITIALGPLWGLAVLGLVRLFRVLRSRAARRDPLRAPRLAAVWLAVAGATVLWTGGRGPVGFDPAARYAAGLTVLPLALLIAYAIEEGARRAVSGNWVAVAVGVPLALRLGAFIGGNASESPVRWALGAAAVAVLGWLALRTLEATISPQGLRRGALMASLLAAIGLAASDGLAEATRRDDPSGGFRRFAVELTRLAPAGAAVLLTDEVPRPRLVFALRAAFPKARFEVARTWDDAAARLAGPGGPRPRAVVATWAARDGGGAVIAPELRPVGEPLLFAGRELLLYVREGTEPRPGAGENAP